MSGIISYATYLPYWRLERSAIADALGAGSARGSRLVASFDEDSTSMAVEAARFAQTVTPPAALAKQVFLASARPAYLDKTNANAVVAALGLDRDVFAADMMGSVRSAVGALRAGLSAAEPTLVLAADLVVGLPGGSDERHGGDGAFALHCGGSGDFVADYLGGTSLSDEFLDRWRGGGELTSRVWEERFGEHTYVPAGIEAFERGLKELQLAPEAIDHLIVTGPHARSVTRLRSRLGVTSEAIDSLEAQIGFTGAAHPGVLLGSVLDRAGPDELIALLVLADGADCLFFRTTSALSERRQPKSVDLQLASTRNDLSYTTYLTWRGQLRREPPRRPEPAAPSAPPAYRASGWKYGFMGSRCICGTVHLPPQRTCMSCGALDRATPHPMAGATGRVVTFSVDHLAFSESPPVVIAVVDFDEGGRCLCELTDADPATVQIGTTVELTFRKVFTAANAVHNYFWKARPVRGGS